MARPKINLLPDSLDLALYAGDGASIQLTVTNASNAPVDLAGEIIAQVRLTKLDATVKAEFDVDMTQASLGIVIVSLTGEQTTALALNQNIFKGFWDVQWTPTDTEPVTIVQGRVECYADVSH